MLAPTKIWMNIILSKRVNEENIVWRKLDCVWCCCDLFVKIKESHSKRPNEYKSECSRTCIWYVNGAINFLYCFIVGNRTFINIVCYKHLKFFRLWFSYQMLCMALKIVHEHKTRKRIRSFFTNKTITRCNPWLLWELARVQAKEDPVSCCWNLGSMMMTTKTNRNNDGWTRSKQCKKQSLSIVKIHQIWPWHICKLVVLCLNRYIAKLHALEVDLFDSDSLTQFGQVMDSGWYGSTRFHNLKLWRSLCMK